MQMLIHNRYQINDGCKTGLLLETADEPGRRKIKKERDQKKKKARDSGWHHPDDAVQADITSKHDSYVSPLQIAELQKLNTKKKKIKNNSSKNSGKKEVWQLESGQMLECRDCHEQFIFSESEKKYFKSLGFHTKPSRCKICSAAEKEKKTKKI
jgi:hypothetical protein